MAVYCHKRSYFAYSIDTSHLRRFVTYCMQRIALLQSCGVVPVVVFDGGRLPMKREEEGSRARFAVLHLFPSSVYKTGANSFKTVVPQQFTPRQPSKGSRVCRPRKPLWRFRMLPKGSRHQSSCSKALY